MEGNSSQDNKKSLIAKIGVAVVALIAIILLLLKGCSKTPEYTVTFDTDGGSIVASQKIKENGTVERPKDPTKNGYTFAGWYYNDELYDFDTKVTKDMVLKAKWNASDEVAVEKITLNVTDLTLAPGDKYLLEATISPDDATDKELVWSSSDSTIVKIDKNGNIEALKEGVVTITVTTKDGKIKATCTVTVKAAEAEQTTTQTSTGRKPSSTGNNSNTGNNGGGSDNTGNNGDTDSQTTIPVTGVTINGQKNGSMTMYVGDPASLTATVNPNNATNKGVTWSSSNTSVVTVDQNGNIKAVGEGTAVITVTTADGGYTATITITVISRYVITFTALETKTGTYRYEVKVTKNGNPFDAYNTFYYNGKNRSYKDGNNYFPATDIDGSTSTTIKLSNGETVNATIEYKTRKVAE